MQFAGKDTVPLLHSQVFMLQKKNLTTWAVFKVDFQLLNITAVTNTGDVG